MTLSNETQDTFCLSSVFLHRYPDCETQKVSTSRACPDQVQTTWLWKAIRIKPFQMSIRKRSGAAHTWYQKTLKPAVPIGWALCIEIMPRTLGERLEGTCVEKASESSLPQPMYGQKEVELKHLKARLAGLSWDSSQKS